MSQSVSNSPLSSICSLPIDFTVVLEYIESLAARFKAENFEEATISLNPYLTPDSDIWKAWAAGKNALSSLKCENMTALGFHGTHSDNGVENICKTGFNPFLRFTQGQGPGEYFTTEIKDALEYASGTRAVIASLIATGPCFRVRNAGKFLVIENPMRRDISFCLPVFVAYFPSNAEPNALENGNGTLNAEKRNFPLMIPSHATTHRWWWDSCPENSILIETDELLQEFSAKKAEGKKRKERREKKEKGERKNFKTRFISATIFK